MHAKIPQTLAAASLLPLAFCTLFASAAHGQNLTGEIDGVVRDSSGAVIAHAIVTVTNTDRNQLARSTQTNAQGEFTAPLLATGNYSVSVTIKGFQTTTQSEEVHVGLATPLAIVLQPGSVAQTVEVNASTLAPQLDSAAAATLITGTKMTQLSLSSRNFLQLLYIQPGVSGGIPGPLDRGAIASSGTVNSANFSVGGLGASQNGFFVDGQDLQRRSAGGSQIAAYPGIDFIQEMNLERSNYGAEYGGSGSTFVSINTKSGGTAFHGEAFEFFRSQALNANGYFNNLAHIPRPGLRYNDFGYGIGGPVWIPHLTNRATTKTFFYFGQEYLRSETNTQQTLTNIPTAAQRQGAFGAPVCVTYNAAGTCTATAASITQFDPTAQAYLSDIIDKTPLPNSPSDPQGLIATEPGYNNETQTFIRIDHQVTQKLNVFFRYLDDPFHLVVPAGLRQSGGIPGVGTSTVTDGATIFLGHATYVVSSNNVVEGGFSHMQNWVTAVPIGLLDPTNSPDIHPTLPYVSTLARVPNLAINGSTYAAIGPYDNRDPVTQIFINDTDTLGRHTLHFGVNLEYQQAGNNYGQTNAGAFTFSPGTLATGSSETQFDQAFANFLLGRVTTFQQNSRDSATVPHTNLYEAYTQDDFHATPRLTLNAGLRYSYIAQPTSGKLQGFPFIPIVNFVPADYVAANAPTIDSTGLICTKAPCAGGASPNAAYNSSNGIIIGGQTSPYGDKVTQQPKLSFAPRVGFSYDVSGDGRTALRGGFGVYYQLITNVTYQQMATLNPPNVATTTIQNTSFDAPGNGIPALSASPEVLQATQVNAKDPYLQSWSLDLQHQIGRGAILDIGYFGNHAVRLPVSEDLNQPFAGQYAADNIVANNKVTAGNSQALNRIRPYLGYGPIASQLEAFSSNYNSLQVSATKQLAGGSVLSANYTYSKALTNGNNAPQDINNLAAEYGPTTFNRTNIFNANFVYRLPFFLAEPGLTGHLLGGWEVTGIISYGSGLPLTPLTINVDPGGVGLLAAGNVGEARPDYLANPNSGAPHNRLQWFNTAAFGQVPATQYRPGNAGNGSILGPGYGNWDLSLFKNVKIEHGLAMQLRGESFNAFNQTNYSGVATTLAQTNYGQVTSAGPARVLQIAAKLTF